MKAVAKVLDILQGDKNTKFGYLVSTIEKLKEKLQKQKDKLSESRNVCLPLLNAILDGVEKRFLGVFKGPNSNCSCNSYSCTERPLDRKQGYC